MLTQAGLDNAKQSFLACPRDILHAGAYDAWHPIILELIERAQRSNTNGPRYLLFAGEGHRPDGGKWELTGVFETMAEAQDAIGGKGHTFIVGSQSLELASKNRAEGGLINSVWFEDAT